MKYKIKNWENFQHYKDRNPPWIKLHFAILSSEDWVMLDDASRVLAVASMLVASRNEGVVDTSERGRRYMRRVAYLDYDPDFNPLIECGFLVDASNMLADDSAALADARPEERQRRDRGETEERKEKEYKYTRKVELPDGFSISARVKRWAEKNNHGKLDEHLEAFKHKASAKGYKYKNWDDAFMEAVRADWANLGKKAEPERDQFWGVE